MRRLIICSILLALAATANAAQPIRLGLNYPSTGNYKSEGLGAAPSSPSRPSTNRAECWVDRSS